MSGRSKSLTNKMRGGPAEHSPGSHGASAATAPTAAAATGAMPSPVDTGPPGSTSTWLADRGMHGGAAGVAGAGDSAAAGSAGCAPPGDPALHASPSAPATATAPATASAEAGATRGCGGHGDIRVGATGGPPDKEPTGEQLWERYQGTRGTRQSSGQRGSSSRRASRADRPEWDQNWRVAKTRLCKDYVQSEESCLKNLHPCSRGDRCPWAHSLAEVRQPTSCPNYSMYESWAKGNAGASASP